MVSAHDPENGPGTRGPGNSRPSLTRPRKPAGTAADQQVSRLVTPDTTEKPGRSEYQDNQPGISDKSYRVKRRTPLHHPVGNRGNCQVAAGLAISQGRGQAGRQVPPELANSQVV